MAAGAASGQQASLIIRTEQLSIGSSVDTDTDRCCSEKTDAAGHEANQQIRLWSSSRPSPPPFVHDRHPMADRGNGAAATISAISR